MPASVSNLFKRTNTELYVRILPPLGIPIEHAKILDDQKTIYIRCWQDFINKQKNALPRYLSFHTSGIFIYTPQVDIFDEVTGNGLFEKLIYGNNAMILCYGQTGSGKSLTASGLERSYEDRGLLPRIMEKLFRLKEELSDHTKFCLKLQYVETNRNYLVDLLANDGKLYDMTSYKTIRPVRVESLPQALKLLFKAEAHKTVREIGAYKSNIANCIATITIYTKGQNTAMSEGTLHVIDLAGIDTIGNASCAHKKGFEVGNGNLAKSQIEQLVLIINENLSKTAVLKQRLCILVHYLRKVLNSNSLIRIIAHIRVEFYDLKICTSLLKLGCSFKGMVPKRLTRYLETSIDVQYQIVVDELRALKREMDLIAMVSNEDMSGTLSSDRLEYIQRIAMEYLKGQNSELVLLTTTDTILVMKVIKNVYKKLEEKFEESVAKSDDAKQGTLTDSTSLHVIAMPHLSARINRKASFNTNSKRKALGKGSDASLRETMSQKSKATSGRPTTKKRVHSLEMSEIDINVSVTKAPDDIPEFKAAWAEYLRDNDRGIDIHSSIKHIDEDLLRMTMAYNKQVQILEERKVVANARTHELNHALLIKDVAETSDDLVEFQNRCIKICADADSSVLEQKENILRLQAELRLSMEHKARLEEELRKRFNEFCLQKYKILVPVVPNDDSTVVTEVSELPLRFSNFSKTAKSIDNQDSDLDAIECKKQDSFNQLRDYMGRERKRVQQLKLKNKKWINIINSDLHGSA